MIEDSAETMHVSLGVTTMWNAPCSRLPSTQTSSEPVTVSERTGMSLSQLTDEVLYTGLIEMQELPELE